MVDTSFKIRFSCQVCKNTNKQLVPYFLAKDLRSISKNLALGKKSKVTDGLSDQKRASNFSDVFKHRVYFSEVFEIEKTLYF